MSGGIDKLVGLRDLAQRLAVYGACGGAEARDFRQAADFLSSLTSEDAVERVTRAIGEHYDGYADPVDTSSNWNRATAAARTAIDTLRNL